MERKKEVLIGYDKELGKTKSLPLLQLLHLMLDSVLSFRFIYLY